MSEEKQTTGENLEQAIDNASAAVSVQTGQLQELEEGPTGEPIGLDSLMNVPVRLTVQVGRTRLTLAQLVQMGPGSLIPLDREAHEPADILVNGKVVARGEIVTIDDRYGVRIASVITNPQP